jgi:AcrR family transcriptional regulator
MSNGQNLAMAGPARADEATKDRLLDAAERLFAEYGYEGTSVRAINTEASVNSGAIHYYFRTKDELFREVVNRRGRVLAAERTAALAACAEGPDRPPLIEQIIAAYIGPYAAPALGSREKRLLFARLRARLMADNRDIDSSPLGPDHEATGRRFVAALAKALPDLPAAEVELRYLIMWGALNTLSAGLGRAALGHAVERDPDPIGEFETMMPRLTALFAGMFRMPRGSSAPLWTPDSGRSGDKKSE